MPGHVPRGAPCLLTNDRLDPVSHQFESDCGPQDFCGPVGSTSAASTPPRATASAPVGSTSAAAASSSLRAAASARPALSSATEADPADADGAEDEGGEDGVGDDDFGDDDGAADGSELRRRAGVTAPPSTSPPSAVCQERRCRRELYPFGYRYNETLPPLCPVGRFCPDEGNECQPLVPLGGSCQFGRDGAHAHRRSYLTSQSNASRQQAASPYASRALARAPTPGSAILAVSRTRRIPATCRTGAS